MNSMYGIMCYLLLMAFSTQGFTGTPQSRGRSADSRGANNFSARQDIRRRYPPRRNANRNPKKLVDDNSFRTRRAQQIEASLLSCLERMEIILASPSGKPRLADPPLAFPSVRDCNAALATFGDNGEFLRALKLFVKMRKAASLAQSSRQKLQTIWRVPAPTLVTYSTLMSRANKMGKARVSLRLWNLLQLQAELFSSSPAENELLIPDVKACNILMNSHAKLADVTAAQELMTQMRFGNGTDVPYCISPNLVTYNTLLDACHKAGDLPAALAAKEQLEAQGLRPDARTYTSLMASVARKASTASGANDPSLAFSFLKEMMAQHIRPNGMTYSALIDACGRCGRSDLALQGLRIMLRQKRKEGIKGTIPNEVGAWTAAIDACGKAGRVETALKLFYRMQKSNFAVKPNTITCGCLTDRLLRYGRMAEALDVLRYMEREGLVPSEVMYTSLMSSAGDLHKRQTGSATDIWKNDASIEILDPNDDTKAIEVYTELMGSLIRSNRYTKRFSKQGTPARGGNHYNPAGLQKATNNDPRAVLVKVFLVFQEMKAVGAEPDLACYNALLRACARAGDFERAQEVLGRLLEAGLDPNDTSWRELIRSTGQRSDLAERIWKQANQYEGGEGEDSPIVWQPSALTFGAMASSYLRHARSLPLHNNEARHAIYAKVIELYEEVLASDERRGLNRLDATALHENSRTMLLILQAILEMRGTTFDSAELQHLKELGTSIVNLECLKDAAAITNNRGGSRALDDARRWLLNTEQIVLKEA